MTDEMKRLKDHAQHLIDNLPHGRSSARAINAVMNCIDQMIFEIDTIRFKMRQTPEVAAAIDKGLTPEQLG